MLKKYVLRCCDVTHGNEYILSNTDLGMFLDKAEARVLPLRCGIVRRVSLTQVRLVVLTQDSQFEGFWKDLLCSFTLLLFLRSDGVCSTGIGSGSCVAPSAFLAVLLRNRFSASCFIFDSTTLRFAVFIVSPSSFALLFSTFSCFCHFTVVVRDVAEQSACVGNANLGMSLDKAEARVLPLVGSADLGMSFDKAEARVLPLRCGIVRRVSLTSKTGCIDTR